MNYQQKELSNYVQALSGKEKWYFKYFCEAFIEEGESPFYLDVFSGLAFPDFELPKVSEEQSKQAMTSAKRKIFGRLSDVMLFYHRRRSDEMTIRNYLGKVEIFFLEHNLPDQANYLLQKALALSRKHEAFDLLLSCLTWERKINIVLEAPDRPQAMILEEEREVYKKLIQISELEDLFLFAKNYKREHGYVTGALQEELSINTIRSERMPALENCHSGKAVYYFNFVHALYCWMTRDHINGYRYSSQLLASNAMMLMPNDYLDGVLEHVNASFCMGLFDQALEGLNVALTYADHNKLSQSNAYSIKLFAYQSAYQLMIYNYQGEHHKLGRTINAVFDKLELYSKSLPLEVRQVIMGNLMNACIGIGDEDRADAIRNQLFRKRSKAVRMDIYDSLYFFRLFYLLQTKTYVLLPGLALIAYRYYRKSAPLQFEVEFQIASLLKKEYNYEDKKVRKLLLDQIKEMLTGAIIKMAVSNRFQEHYTFYLIWIESIASGQPFHECAQKWHKAFCKRNKPANVPSL